MTKKLFLMAFFCLMFGVTLSAQSSDNTMRTVPSPDSPVNYRLYQTQNIWTFLKLDTRNGIINHVQYSTEGYSMQYPLNDVPLAEGADAVPGRFFLYPSKNTYNFILLDQIDGRVWQVQWSIEEEDRGVWEIY